MMGTELMHRKNVILITLISVFYFFQIIINIIIEGLESIFPPAYYFFVLGSILSIMIYKKVNPKITMYAMIGCMYVYFYFLLKETPYLVNFLFMLLGIPLSTIYQNYRVVVIAGVSSMILTYFSFFYLHAEIFPNVDQWDFVYLITFDIFLTIFQLIVIYNIRKVNIKYQELAYQDSLTGAANRLFLKEKFQLLKLKKVQSIALIFIDMNGFKKINDTYGHEVGDQLLEIIVSRLKGVLRETDLLCRLGGDEFVVLASNVDHPILEKMSERIQTTLEKPIIINHHTIHVSASIGWYQTTQVSHADLDQMIKEADIAMYRAKGNQLIIN